MNGSLSYDEVRANFTSSDTREVSIPFTPEEIQSFREKHFDNSSKLESLDKELKEFRKSISDQKNDLIKENAHLVQNVIRGAAFVKKEVYEVPDYENETVGQYVLEGGNALYVGTRTMTITERNQLRIDMPNVHQISKVI